MANNQERENKIREKYKALLVEKDDAIKKLEEENKNLTEQIKDLRKKLYDAGEGAGEKNRLNRIIKDRERENKTLQNQVRELDGSKFISTFSKDRQDLIKNIKKLNFNNGQFKALARRLIDGVDNVIQVAYLISLNSADEMDFYTYVFRDNIVGLFEKMLKAVLGKSEESASKYLASLVNGKYSFPKHYLEKIPNLKDKQILTNILYLINLQSTGYHGTKTRYKKVKLDKDTNEYSKYEKFLNLNNKDQLDAIFTLLEFMYDVFINKDHEVNLSAISSSWFTTMNI